MCGIIGYSDTEASEADAARSANRWQALCGHRGPDGSGIYADEDVILGMSALDC